MIEGMMASALWKCGAPGCGICGPAKTSSLPTDSEARKGLPIMTGFMDYFPAAAAAVARLSKIGNDKHNPGEPLHWARGKSMDHADTIARHQIERGTRDTDGEWHDTKVAWRAMAQLQELLEKEEGAPLPRAARLQDTSSTISSVQINSGPLAFPEPAFPFHRVTSL